MKRIFFPLKIVTATLLLVSHSVYAVAPGFYLGLMTGPASNDGNAVPAQIQGATTDSTLVTPRSKQWGSRAMMGYKVSSYAGWELGLSYFSTIHYDTKGVETCSSLASRVRGVDFVGRASMTVRAVDVFAKAGVLAAYITTPGAFYSAPADSTCGKTSNQIAYRPTVSVGASYDVSPSWVMDVSWTRQMIGGVVKNVDLLAFGISYHFVDQYCGQFLCDY